MNDLGHIVVAAMPAEFCGPHDAPANAVTGAVQTAERPL